MSDMSRSALENGPEDDDVLLSCQSCDGEGQVYRTRFSGARSTCRECDGEGEILVLRDELAQPDVDGAA